MKLWVQGLKSAFTDIAFQIYIANEFRTHMKLGLHNEATTDFVDIGDLIIQWVNQRDKLRAEVKQNFPHNSNSNPTVSSGSTSANINRPVTNIRSSRAPAHKIQKVLETEHTSTLAVHTSSTFVKYEICYVCGKCYHPRCVLQIPIKTQKSTPISGGKSVPLVKQLQKLKVKMLLLTSNDNWENPRVLWLLLMRFYPLNFANTYHLGKAIAVQVRQPYTIHMHRHMIPTSY